MHVLKIIELYNRNMSFIAYKETLSAFLKSSQIPNEMNTPPLLRSKKKKKGKKEKAQV